MADDNPSLNRKSAARMAATQCIYQTVMNAGTISPEQLVEQYKLRAQDAPEPDDEDEDESGATAEELAAAVHTSAEPDYRYLLQLLEGWQTHRPAIEQSLDDSLLEGWTRKRMSPLMVAILCCALTERQLHPSLKPAVWVDEYVTLTGRFFSEQETGFVNRLLDHLGKAQPAT